MLGNRNKKQKLSEFPTNPAVRIPQTSITVAQPPLPANPNSHLLQFTLVPFPLHVFTPTPLRIHEPAWISFRSPSPSSSSSSSASSPCSVWPSVRVPPQNDYSVALARENQLVQTDFSAIYRSVWDPTPPASPECHDPEKLNDLMQELNELIKPPATSSVPEQVANGMSLELVVPDIQFPDDITDVEPLMITTPFSSLPVLPPPPVAIPGGVSSELGTPESKFPDDIKDVEPLRVPSAASFSPPVRLVGAPASPSSAVIWDSIRHN